MRLTGACLRAHHSPLRVNDLPLFARPAGVDRVHLETDFPRFIRIHSDVHLAGLRLYDDRLHPHDVL